MRFVTRLQIGEHMCVDVCVGVCVWRCVYVCMRCIYVK